MPEPYTMPDVLASTDARPEPVAGSGGANADRAALEQALVPDHHHGD